MTHLKYHRKSLELIGCQPEFNGATDPGLPASVAEWFSLVNGVKLLEKYSNQDSPIPPSEFKTYKHGDKELVVFMYENQGVVWWAYEKCNSDDPPVYINFDPPPDNWLPEVETFSTFIYTWLFDHIHWFEDNLFIMESGKLLDENALKFLQKDFFQEPTTFDWDSLIKYRFSSNDQKITIMNDVSQSNWTFSADTQESLNNVYKKLKHLLQ
jgi:hypothetical protein